MDTEDVIYPILQPVMKVLSDMYDSAKALESADQAKREREAIKLPKSVFDLFTPKPPTTTTQRPLIERLLEPIVEPIKMQLNKLEKSSRQSEAKLKSTSSRQMPLCNDQIPRPPQLMLNNDEVRRSPQSYDGMMMTSPVPQIQAPLLSLLESFGSDAHKSEQIQVGHDNSVNVLGMPVGRRDGLILSPQDGLSLGNQDMYGPVAVNDKYNVNWGFLNKLGRLFEDRT